MHQTKTRGEEEQAGKVGKRKKKGREKSWLLGLIHGYLLDLQTVVRTDG